MKKIKSILSVGLISVFAIGLSGCREDMAGININPSSLTDATPAQMLTTAELALSPYGYGTWFFGAPNMLKNTQMCVRTGSMTGDNLRLSSNVLGGSSTENLRYLNGIKNLQNYMSEEEAKANEAYRAAAEVLAIYAGIYDTDNQGDIQYTEAASAAYDGPLKPKFDKVKDLYDLWNDQLKECVSVFKNPGNGPEGGFERNQDIIFRCDWNKWAKFANSLRVKLATRLIHQDLAKAKQIVGEAVAAGVITEMEDDVLFHKADVTWGEGVPYDRGDLAYGSGNSTIQYWGIGAAQKVVDFMIANGDPRVRFIFTKNSWNSKIVDFYLKNDYADLIPPVVMDMVETETVGGKTVFKNWKGKGEPWVRYVGLPDVFEGANSADPLVRQYFQWNATVAQGGNTIHVDGVPYNYRPYSIYQEEHIRQRQTYTIPTAPGDEIVRDNVETNPRYDMYITAAEINFYLAEFATYGGVSGLGSAADYFKKAVKQSVETWDKLASLNKIPYYGQTYGYDPNEEVIDLQPGEVDALTENSNYKLTGVKADDLEKIFLNLEFHFMLNPVDNFVTGRRSGIPKFNSTLLPRTDYANAGFPANSFNRRGYFSTISPTNIMADIIAAAYESQGIHTEEEAYANYLNTERLWQDVGAPQWGAGPNVGL